MEGAAEERRLAALAALRRRLLHFLITAAARLQVQPATKYAALVFYADRFLPSLSRKRGSCGSGSRTQSWLLEPLRESNLELFTLVAIWVASKIYELKILSVRSLKAFGDRAIVDQHFTTRDFADAELVFMEVLDFQIGASDLVLFSLEELIMQFRQISKMGELVDFGLCLDILDLLYETEESATLFSSPGSLAASTLVCAYLLSVPEQRWEFPLLPWVEFATSYKEEDITKIVAWVLDQLFKPDLPEKNSSELGF